MKKSTIIIIVVSSTIVLVALTAGGIMILNSLGSIMQELPNEFIEEGTETETEAETSEAINSVTKTHNAVYWEESIETGYSYEAVEILQRFQNKPVVFAGTLTDIVFEDGKYIAFFQDNNNEIYPSIIYWINCTEEQKSNLAQVEETETSYYIFITAIRLDEIMTTPLDDDDTWSPPIIVKGSMLGFEKIPASYEYY